MFVPGRRLTKGSFRMSVLSIGLSKNGLKAGGKVFSDPAVCTCLAEEAGVAVGWISFGKSRDEDAVNCGEVYGLHAHPDHWGHGIGGKELWALRYSTAVPARSN